MTSCLKLPDNYHTFSDSALLTLKIDMEKRKDDIKEKIAHLKAKDTDGKLYGTAWYFRAKKADKLYGRDIQLIQLEMTRRKESRRRRAHAIDSRFTVADRAQLSQIDFHSITVKRQEEGCHV